MKISIAEFKKIVELVDEGIDLSFAIYDAAPGRDESSLSDRQWIYLEDVLYGE